MASLKSITFAFVLATTTGSFVSDGAAVSPEPERTAIACAPRDRDCIIDAATDILVGVARGEMDLPRSEHASQAGELLQLAGPERRDEMLSRWKAAGASARFYELLDAWEIENTNPEWVNFGTLDLALSTGEVPGDRDWETFVHYAFKTLRDRNPERAKALFWTHLDRLYDVSERTVADHVQWAATKDVAELEHFTEEYYLPKSPWFNPWKDLSEIAAFRCEAGERAAGDRILVVLEQEKGLWEPDRELKAGDWAGMTVGVLTCRGEQAALAMVDPVLRQMAEDIAAAKKKFPPEGLEFVLGVIRSVVSEGMIAPLVVHLVENGRRTEAEALYAREPFRLTTLDGERVLDGPTAMEFEPQSLDAFLEVHELHPDYDPDDRKALEGFLRDTTSEGMDMEFFTNLVSERIERLWPDPLAEAAARRLLQILALEYLAGNADDLWSAETRLRFAALDRKTSGCELGDDRLAELLGRIASAPYDRGKPRALVWYVRYLDTPSGGTGDGACAADW